MPITRNASLDAIVIGSGVNGLAAAITLARAGRSVRVYEQQSSVGGSARSMPLTLPGYTHDWGATVQALVPASRFFREVTLESLGVALEFPAAPFAHPLDDESAAVVERSVDATAARLLSRDASAYRKLVAPLVNGADELMKALLQPLGPNRAVLAHPLLVARFGLNAVQSVWRHASRTFTSDSARAIFAGAGAHSMLSLRAPATAGYALTLVLSAHAYGWPVVRGGTGQLIDAMVLHLKSLGGEVIVNTEVHSLSDLPASRAILCDLTPRQLLQIAGTDMPAAYAKRVSRFRYGSGVFKMDWALSQPVPWRADACNTAGTVHVGGTMTEIAQGERDVAEGRHPEKPFVLAVQASRFDPTRAPIGHHTLWAYCHVPSGSTFNMQDRIEQQIERFAPGFRDCVVARMSQTSVDLERANANLIGGDIGSGAGNLVQLFARPVIALDPYKTAMDGVYLCSSSTPPGVGIHGMCGYNSAQSALRHSLNE